MATLGQVIRETIRDHVGGFTDPSHDQLAQKILNKLKPYIKGVPVVIPVETKVSAYPKDYKTETLQLLSQIVMSQSKKVSASEYRNSKAHMEALTEATILTVVGHLAALREVTGKSQLMEALAYMATAYNQLTGINELHKGESSCNS